MLAEIQRLSIAERIQLVEDIWDSIATTPDDLALTEAQCLELDRRLQLIEQNPQEGITWLELKTRLKNQ